MSTCFRKSSLALILSLLMLTGILGSTQCSAESSGQGGTELQALQVNNPKDLLYFSALPSNAEGVVDNLSEVLVYKELEKRTNVKVTFFHVPVSQLLQRFHLMMASMDLPDMIEIPWSKYPGLMDMAVELGALQKLDNLIADSAPNLNGIILNDSEIRRQITRDDGCIYQVPSLNLAQNRVDLGLIVRSDLLKKLNLKVPQTIGEWELMLQMFKSQGVCKNPVSFDMTALNNSNLFFGAFGVSRGFSTVDGKVVYDPVRAEYKGVLTLLNKWYKNGLIDPEFIILKGDQVKNKVAKGDVGAFIGTTEDIGTITDSFKAGGLNYELEAVPNPVLIENWKPAASTAGSKVRAESGVVLSVSNKRPDDSLKWLDYAYSQEGYRLFNYGVEGVTYKLENGIPTYTDLILNNPEGLTVSKAMGKYLRAAPPVPGFTDDASLSSAFKYQEQARAPKVWTQSAGLDENGILPPVSLTRVENNEIGPMVNDLNTYTMEMFAKFVLGAESLENFDNYVKTVERLGVGRVVQVMQDALYRYDNRLESERMKITVNGSEVDTGIYPALMGKSLMVPVKTVMEAAGGSAVWDEDNMQAVAAKDGITLRIKAGSVDAECDGNTINAGNPAILMNSRMFADADLLSRVFGIKIVLEGNTVNVEY